jgi:hypothetical protein
MALWQTVLGSLSGVITGTVLACIGYYLHIRYVDKDSVSLRAIFWVLSGARPGSSPSRDSALASDQKQKALQTPDMAPGSSVMTKDPLEALFPVQEVSKQDVLGLLSEFERDLKMIRECPPKAFEPLKTDAFDSNQPLARRLLCDLANDLDTIHTGDPAPASDQRDRHSQLYTAPPPASTSDFMEALFPVQDQRKEDVLGLIAEFERNIKTIREFSGGNLLPLRTDAWEGNRPLVRSLPIDIRSQLESIYTDIGLLNNLAWLSSEFNRHSPSMLQQYAKLSTSIGDRLDKMIRSSLFRATQEEQGSGSAEQMLV